MDWLCKAALTAGAVFVVLEAARHFGQRAAGVVAALPIITAPTLVWVASEHGVAFAVSVSVGSVSACAIMAAFALGYARGSRRGGVAGALASGLLGASAISVPASIVSTHLGEALALALGCCAAAMALLPASHDPARSARPIRRSHLAPTAIALVAGALSALAATIGPDLGGFATGLLSSLPLIGGGVAIHEHAVNGPRAAERFLHGYVRGLFSKTAFGAVFALLAMHVGVPASLLLAVAVAVAAACMLSHPRARPLPEVPRLRRSD